MHPIIETIAAGITWTAIIAALIWLALIIIRDALQRGDEQYARDNPAPAQRYPVDAEANRLELNEFAAKRDLARGTSDNLGVKP